jgi:putative endonuclease
MYITYILYSKAIDQVYIGQTHNIEERLLQHNSFRSKSTKKVNDWVLVYKEVFVSRSDAMVREKEIKSKKSRKYIEKLISSPNSYQGG